MAEQYEGGCHCGAVRFKCEADLSTVLECNCSHCSKKGFLLVFVPKTQFELTRGEDRVTEYRFNTHKIAHQFCSACGVQAHGYGKMPDGTETVAINARCIDGVDIGALNRVPYDGANA